MRRPRRPRPRLPVAAERAYVRLLRDALAQWQAHVLAAILREHGQHPGRAHLRTEAAIDRADEIASFVDVPIQHLDGVRGARQDAMHFPGLHVDPHDLGAIGMRIAKQNAGQFQKLIGIPIADLGLGAEIDIFRERNVALIRSLGESQIDEITDILEQATAEGWHVAALREAIEERFGVGESHADLIARDQTLKMSGEITQRRQTDAGVEAYTWRASGDERVRPAHADLDGTVQRWDDPPVTNDAGDTNAPGGDYQCRCTADPLLAGIDYDEDSPPWAPARAAEE